MRWLSGGILITLIFVLYHVSTSNFFNKVAVFSLIDWIVIAYLPGIFVFYHFFHRYAKHKKVDSTDVFWISTLVVTILAVLTFWHVTTTEVSRAILLGAYFASLGWIYTNHTNVRNQTKSHT